MLMINGLKIDSAMTPSGVARFVPSRTARRPIKLISLKNVKIGNSPVVALPFDFND